MEYFDEIEDYVKSSFKTKDLFKYSTNKSFHNKLKKEYYAKESIISCSICKYNRGENRKQHGNKNWKCFRLNQYKNKDL